MMPNHSPSASVSVITAVRNGGATIRRTLESLRRSTVTVEHIVIDCQSTDDTLRHVAEVGITKHLISEPDKGLSDAWNKGIRSATAPYVSFLSADDWYEPDFIEKALQPCVEQNADISFGDVDLVNEHGRTIKVVRGHFRRSLLFSGLGFLHPSAVFKRQLFDKCGTFDLSLRMAMDCDWVLRAEKQGAVLKKHSGLCHMSASGMSNRGWRLARSEYEIALKNNRYGTTMRCAAALYTKAISIKRRFQQLNSPG